MKKVFLMITALSIFAILTAFSISSNNQSKVEVVFAQDYCDGWGDGYCEGWKDVKGPYSICPITPICPIPQIGKDRYIDGYNRGFKAGSRAAQRK